MEQLTVISGSGESFELALTDNAALQRAAVLREKMATLSPEQLRMEVVGIFREIFPSRYQEPLERISAADAFKLASAFALLYKNDKAEVFFKGAEKLFSVIENETAPLLAASSAQSESCKREAPFVIQSGRGEFSELEKGRFKIARKFEKDICTSVFPLSDKTNSPFFVSEKLRGGERGSQKWGKYFFTAKENLLEESFSAVENHLAEGNLRVNEEAFFSDVQKFCKAECVFSEKQPSEELRSMPITDDIILAAYSFKWSLEYAASLPPELLRRCLEIAGGGRKSVTLAEIPEAMYSPEAVRRAAVRAAEAVANYRKSY